jgi:hypothetical protein
MRTDSQVAMVTETLESRTLMAVTPFDVPVVASGETPVTLYPIESVAPGVTTRVSFGVPFPKGFVTDLATVRLLDAADAEKAVHVSLLTPWRDLATGTNLSSVRSALVQVDVAFPDSDGDGDADPLNYTIEWGTAARSVPAITPLADIRSNWIQYNNASAPAGTDYKTADNVFEPPAYALFTPAWYGEAALKTRLLPAGSDSSFSGYEDAFANFAETAVNDVDPRVTAGNLVHYVTTDEPWLFDRATALYQLAFRTGNVKFLREGHRGAQFYANHISAQGYFDLKGDDLKYVTGEAISIDYWLTGDARMIQVHQRMNPMFDHAQNATYNPGGFWTERHAAYKLLGYVTGYELLGDATLAQKARDTFTVYVNHQNNPPAGAPNTGMLMHLKPDHGEGGSNEWIASPWMSVFLVDAVQRYYLHSGDSRVANFVTRMADGINHVGESMYYTDAVDGETHLQPFYLAGPNLTDAQREMDEWGDMEHGVDVSKIFALAYFFTKQAGSPSSVYLGRFEELADTGQAAFNYWTRPNAPASGLTAFRLSPARKFNWWFRTTADRDFLLGGDSGGAPDTQAPGRVLSVSGLSSGGGTHHSFSLTYTDNRAINVSTIDSNDVRVTGPNGYNQLAQLVSVSSNTNGTPRIATYRIPAPGGVWDAADDGNYSVSMVASQVADTAGLFVPGEFLASFAVATAGAPSITDANATAITSGGATITWTTNESASTQVEYGTTGSFGTLTTLDATLGTGHSVVLTGLLPNTLYHYRLLSRNAGGTLATSGGFTFTTAAGPVGGGGGTGGTAIGSFGLMANRTTLLKFVDADGTAITVSLKGGGTGQAFLEDGRVVLELTGTGPKSTLSLTGKGGDRRISLGGVHAAGPLKGLKATTADLFGTLFIAGPAGALSLGTINGGTVAAAGVIFGLAVKGGVSNGRVLAGVDLGADAELGGGDDAAVAAVIRKITIGATATGSVFAAGVLPGANGTYGDGDDVGTGAASSILMFSSRGDVDATSRFEAGTFGRAKIGRLRADPTTDPRFMLLA